MVILLAITGGLLLCLAIIVRELSVSRERKEAESGSQELREAVEALRMHLERTSDELFVLRTTLEERRVVDAKELAKNRLRLTAERKEVTGGAAVDPTRVIIDEGESVH